MILPISKRAVNPRNAAPALPPMKTQAANLAKAGATVAGSIIRMEDPLRSASEARRLVEHYCKGHGTGDICPRFRFIDSKCADCGCPVLKRARIAHLGCPQKKF